MDAQVPKNDATGARRPLLESLASLGRAAFDPSGTDRAAAQQQFHDLLRRTPPVALLPALNVLIQPNRGAPAWLQAEYMRQLALLPLRADDGVRATLEFVFAMHPSSAAAAEAEAAAAGPAAGPGGGKSTAPQKQGAHITQEALQMATRLLASPPAATPAGTWFRGIAPQLLALLDGRDGLELAKVASYVIGFGILGRKSFGAPGKPGWANFAEPMLRCIDPQLRQETDDDDDKDRVVELRRNAAAVLVPDADVAQGLRRLQTLVLSHPNPGLARRLLGPVVLPLWALSTWSGLSAQGEEAYGLPARNLLKIYLRIAPSPDKVLPIARDLLYNGARDAERAPPWAYESVEDGPAAAAADTNADARQNTSRICIVSAPSTPLRDLDVLQTRWHEIGPKADALVDLLASIAADDEEISAVFLSLFGRWLASRGKPSNGGGGGSGGGVVLVQEEEDDQSSSSSSSSPLQAVLEGSLLQKMMERFPEKLAGRPDHILALVAGILGGTETAPDAGDSETLPVVLSLLNLVVMAPGFRRAKVDAAQLQAIEDGLARVGAQTPADDDAAAADTAKTAQNLLLLLRYKDELDDADAAAKGAAGSGPAAADPQQEQRQQARQKRLAEDRKTQSLALAYITQADAPPPVRSEGLSLLQGLVQANSAVLDIPALLVLLSSLLGGDEDYINLRVMRLFVAVAERHPRATTRELLEHYVDAAETKSVDTRLRFGEALLQVVQRLGETFAGETAQAVGAALLETAGRRPQRPKTAAKQARAEKMAEMKRKRAAEQGEGEEEEDDDDDEEEADEEDDEADRQRNAILRGIVDGWGSRRGSEDVRIRASALSVLATAVDTNVAGLGGPLASAAVDLALHVLTLEAGPGRLDRAILRRAAIVLVLSFVRALDAAAQNGRRLGFGLTPQSQAAILRILRYVASTDEDELVRQHAHDAIESLEAWQVSALLPAGGGDDDGGGAPMLPAPGSQLPRLAGLSLDPAKVLGGAGGDDDAASAATQVRPRIEEVE